MTDVKVKICGIMSLANAEVAVEAGADALGLIFYDSSPRNVDLLVAREISLSVPPFVDLVGVFVNPKANEVEAVLKEVPLSLLQFHGEEPPEFCQQFQYRYIKSIRMREAVDLGKIEKRYHSAVGLLLDSFDTENHGGTGRTFDWQLAHQVTTLPKIIAGGLTPENVISAIDATQPYAVDVSSGVESSPGVKSSAKIGAFVAAVKQHDYN